ncbi:MarR family winged helix-turn-helix transcriptional regulator [Neobittarella massiliensis]|uniref:MarR family transcriptional regulator n=2 Tax=Oscillospiraceae TaxID=216572 RepID=A0A8J6IPZ4_9FIRM|nr:MarR family transcriptional regulator [Neobittarella massiliensis]MBC3516186.1 MarR family transcriptional regulator [Neobittarella massiliensis]SCJ85800.1 homoprotocatechuate degradation operon regulator%2C HpaR [uncultured Anaerotruncus sp.]
MEFTQFKQIVWDLDRSMRDSMDRALQPLYSHYGLTAMQVFLLMTLRQTGPLSVGQLSERMGMAGANGSALAKKIAGLGLLERRRSREDERVVQIDLSQKGRDTIDAIESLLQGVYGPLLYRVDPGTLQTIVDGLRALDALLDEIRALPMPDDLDALRIPSLEEAAP